MPLQPPPAVLPLTEAPLQIALNPAAPLSSAQPSANPIVNGVLGLGPVAAVNVATTAVAGPEVPLIAGALGVVVEWVKNRSWWREGSWTMPLLIVLSFGVAFLVWFVLFGDALRAITNGCGILTTAHVNYTGSQVAGVGVFRPTAEENRWQPPGSVNIRGEM